MSLPPTLARDAGEVTADERRSAAPAPASRPEKRRIPRAPERLMRELAERGVQRHYRAGTLLIQEGDVGDSLFVILSGRLRAFASDPNGKEITLGVHTAGDFVGEMAFDGGPRSASIEALEPSVCSMVSRETLTAFISEHPTFAFDLLARVIRRARMATESARNFALMDVYGRLTQLLNELAVPQPDGSRRIPERMTHQEIAGRVACSREMISRLLKDLEAGGYIELRERKLTLLKNLPARW